MNITELSPSNYYGSLCIMEKNGEYFWCVENWDGHNWSPIPKSLYNTLKRQANKEAKADEDN